MRNSTRYHIACLCAHASLTMWCSSLLHLNAHGMCPGKRTSATLALCIAADRAVTCNALY